MPYPGGSGRLTKKAMPPSLIGLVSLLSEDDPADLCQMKNAFRDGLFGGLEAVHKQMRVIAEMVAKYRTRLSEGFEKGELSNDQVQQGYFFSFRVSIEAFGLPARVFVALTDGAPPMCSVMLLNRAAGVAFY